MMHETQIEALRRERIDILASMIQDLDAKLDAERARAGRLEAALSNLIHDAAGGAVIIPAGSLKEARPIQWWYTDPDGEIEITVVYE